MKIPSLPIFVAVLLAVPFNPVFAGPEPDSKAMSPAAQMSNFSGFYLAVFGGANVSQDYGNARTDFTGAGGPFTYRGSASDHVGGVGGIKAGYTFDPFASMGDIRLQFAGEAELYYVGTKTDVHSRFFPGDDFDLRGNMNNGVFMLNGLVKFKSKCGLTPYVGAGVGTEYITMTGVHLKESVFGEDPVQHNSNTFAPAVQAVGGLEYEIARHWTVFTEYKYLVAIDPSLDFGDANFGVRSLNLKLDPYEIAQHLLTIGVKYNF